jgi:Carbohydrate-selective porin, OprB family
MLSQTAYRAIRLSGIFISLAIITANSPASAKPNLLAASPEKSEAKPAGDIIKPDDRNYQILQGLNNRYQCGITASKQTMSRADFTTNLEVCLKSLEIKLAQNSKAVTPEDTKRLSELTQAFRNTITKDLKLAQNPEITPPPPETVPPEAAPPEDTKSLLEQNQQFRDEVTNLGERIEKLETTVVKDKNSAFSITTKLAGEVILGLNGFGGAPGANGSNTTFSDRIRLNFDTSFTGKDRLRTRLQARNTTPFNTAVTGTNTTRLGFDGSEDNASFVSLLQYKAPIGDKSNVIIETVGSEFNENMYTFNPLLASAGTGSISRFGRYNPVYRQSGDGAAATVDYKLTEQITGSIGYAVPGTAAANPAINNGIFGGSNALISQLRFQATPEIDLGLVYARSYHTGGTGITGSTGTAFANNPFGGARTSANHYNFLASAKLAPGFVLSGWAGVTNATRETAAGGTADIFNYAISAAFPDFGSKGNTLGFIVGGPPKVTRNSVAARLDTANPLHIEALYKVKFSDNVDITPGLLLITNPDTSTKGTEYVGTIRTTLKF